ncbi:CopG family transcriptional regulator [Thermococcus chitonophagus]|uniref:CopG family transcriptional regulator n=1 Tax=Thermococcus chitonophagus TaxID=54262 RepID=A0A160VS68_9EURY|nr:ribbon-helix-helix domain-containing protein [Thermococcus chitonophagus]ASJ17055.1 CopG family transcriptional regulator [Thermococcus chitonophagus]CUX77650.1 Transcription regulator, CopG/RepA family [Thermococcus chitonophagus]
MATTIKISVRLPPKIVEEIDRLVQNGVFSSRSDFIKEAVRHYLRELRKEELTEEEKWVLNMVQPILAEDWNSKEDKFWDEY